MAMAVVVSAALALAFAVALPSTGRSGPDHVLLPRANVAAPGLIVDPSITRPDPYITWDPATRLYRLYTSWSPYGLVPEWSSPRVTGPWTLVGDALRTAPPWSAQWTWAPEVNEINGTWTLWGSALQAGTASYCLYRATAPTAAGPFTATPGRMACDLSLGGDIDPTAIRDDAGAWWLVYKINANAVGRPTSFVAVRIGADGWPSGPLHTILTSSAPWESGMIEAPSLVRDPTSRQLWLVFSAGDPSSDHPTYGVNAVPCDAVDGPCHMESVIHLVASNSQGIGPGEQSVVVDQQGRVWIAYNSSGPFITPLLRPLALVRFVFGANGEPYLSTPAAGQ